MAAAAPAGPLAAIGGAIKNLTSPGGAMSQAPQGATHEAADQQSVNIAPVDTGAEQKDTIQTIPGQATDAGTAAETAAQYYQGQTAPQAGQIQSKQQSAADTALQQQKLATDEWAKSVDQTNKLAVAAENTLKEASAKAVINPNQYLDKMGVPQQVVTAIGMVLSGIGSGLTGQPNLAMKIYETRTQQAIDAQKQNFLNSITSLAQSKDLVRTAQDRETIRSAAALGAAMSVYTGNNAAIQSLMTKSQSATQMAQAKQLQFQNAQALHAAQAAFNQLYMKQMSTGDKRHADLTGSFLQGIMGWFGKGQGTERSNVFISDRTPMPGLGGDGQFPRSSDMPPAPSVPSGPAQAPPPPHQGGPLLPPAESKRDIIPLGQRG